MEPQTAAGRALLLSIGRDEPDDWDDLDWSQVVAGIEAEARAAAERDVAALLSIEAAAREWAAASEDLLNKALPLMGNPSRNARMAAAHKALRQALANPAAEPKP